MGNIEKDKADFDIQSYFEQLKKAKSDAEIQALLAEMNRLSDLNMQRIQASPDYEKAMLNHLQSLNKAADWLVANAK